MKNKSLLGICTEINNMGAVLMIAIVPIQLDKNLLGLISLVVAEVVVVALKNQLAQKLETSPRNAGLQRACWTLTLVWLFN